MKCKFIVPTRSPNPEYSPAEHKRAEENGEIYEHKPYIERPVGHVSEHPQVWRHCVNGFLNSEPRAMPADEECRNKVRNWLQLRPAKIKALAEMLKNAKPTKKSAKDFYAAIREAYAVDLHDIDPDEFPIGGNDDAELYEEDEDD